VLSHVLLQEGSDHNAAEQFPRDVLALAPDHAEAKHNLALMYNANLRLCVSGTHTSWILSRLGAVPKHVDCFSQVP
jgi:hypothetical protein